MHEVVTSNDDLALIRPCATELERRAPHVSVVVTGRNAPEELLAIADLITEMKSIKHPFEQGRKAQVGIDY